MVRRRAADRQVTGLTRGLAMHRTPRSSRWPGWPRDQRHCRTHHRNPWPTLLQRASAIARPSAAPSETRRASLACGHPSRKWTPQLPVVTSRLQSRRCAQRNPRCNAQRVKAWCTGTPWRANSRASPHGSRRSRRADHDGIHLLLTGDRYGMDNLINVQFDAGLAMTTASCDRKLYLVRHYGCCADGNVVAFHLPAMRRIRFRLLETKSLT
jgi:hypothetical protein